MSELRRALAAAILVLAACADNPIDLPDLSVATVEVAPAGRTLTVGDTMLVTAFPRTADGTLLGGREVEWATANPDIASIQPKGAVGVITAQRPGTVEISADVEGRSGAITVNVVAAPLVVATLELTPAFSALQVGGQAQLTAIARTNDGTVVGGRTVSWQSSDSAVITIGRAADGAYAVLTAHRPGDVVITAAVDGKIARREIRVSAPTPVAFMSVEPDSVEAEVGMLLELEAWTYRADGGFIDSVTVNWSTTDNTIATVVSSSGRRVVLRTLRAGNIEVIGAVGATSDRAQLRVRNPANVSRVEIIGSSLIGHSMWSHSLGTFRANVYGTNGQRLPNHPVAWRVDNPSIIDIRADGHVHARLPGTTRIHATSGGVTTSSVLTIYPYPVNGLALELRPGSDVNGQPRPLVPVASSPWTDANGVVHEAKKYLVAGLLTFGGAVSGYQQRLDFETVVSLPNEPWKVVASETVTATGAVFYGMMVPLSEFRFVPATPNAADFHAQFVQPGRLSVRQQIGVAPLLDYFWEVRR